MERKTTVLPFIPIQEDPQKGIKEVQRKTSSVLIAIRKGIIKQIVGLREVERKERVQGQRGRERRR